MSLTTFPKTLSVGAGNAPTPIGIPTPTDTSYGESGLRVIVTGLPTNGTVYLADGVTPVIEGEILSAVQLTGLTFAANVGASGSSSFTYTAVQPFLGVIPATTLETTIAVGTTTPTGGVFTLGSATLTVTAQTGPVTTPATLSVAENAGATAIGINTTGLTGDSVSVLGLPTDGTVTSGGIAVTVGQALTVAQLGALQFTPTPGAAAFSSQFSYTVTNGGGSSVGTAELDIAPIGSATSTLSTIAAQTSSSTGSINGNVLTLSGTTTGTFEPGEIISGTGVVAGTQILVQLSGTTGGAGTYFLSSDDAVTSTTISGTYGLLTVGGTVSGTYAVGGVVAGTGVTSGTTITALVSGNGGAGTYVVSPSQTVASAESIAQSNSVVTVTVAQGGAGLAAAINASVNGETIRVQAGTYNMPGDTKLLKNITLEGVGGMANLVAPTSGVSKGILVTNGNDTINNFSFTGAVGATNSAGIRYQSGNLVLNDDYIFNNENGLLGNDSVGGVAEGAAGGVGTITINHSEFANNGITSTALSGGGFTHNLYVGNIASVTINNSFFFNSNVGHEIKSRAADTTVLNSVIEDGPAGSGSIDIQTPNGGNVTIKNNRIEKGPLAQNNVIIATADAGPAATYANSSLVITGNTILNDLGSSALGVRNLTTVTAQITNNNFFNLTTGQIASGPNTQSSNLFLGSEPALITTQPWAEIGAAPCFCRGTLIRTEAGEVAVEDLAIGDRVVTLSGEAKVIRWIGHRTYDGRFIAGNRAVLPIGVAAGALADGVPVRDLWVSPEHALYLDGVLVRARHLVNGATIAQAEVVERVEYFHIELAAHEIIYAEGAPTESFVDCDNRGMFQNATEFARLYPGDTPPAWQFCAPRLEDAAAELTAIRAALLERADVLGHALDLDPDLQLIVDGQAVRPSSVSGCRYRFDIPAGSTALWLTSRSAVPAEIEAASQDRRRLGVGVERIVLGGAGLRIEIGHDCPTLREGFHDDETGHRWTDGRARLPEELLRPFSGAVTLEVQLITTELRYRVPPRVRIAAAA